ncbi:nucleoside hydrolase [Psychrobacillus lasiicapitis]|uniref:Nucleoside hydrolase n=1 Tax=Psychrobacillus lasiicapitis TaxID=1636719 RepID=A0A544T4W5_9BACI|nr:nucleoside hydrolase [Psychrobacillus lasiicapitis]TQR12490.1 nucleoside hydrolase [Psychrobacillus lasiicapitis]GGA38559.1 pyrimidine-specific ribonucleoside hydrolase RihA [Psychrobacillus lasiicapitis]
MTIPVIIDCDPGIDDVMALTLAFAHPELDIKLITTEPGNQTQEKTIHNALTFTSYMKKNIEIARGLDKPFFRKLEIADKVHGENGLGNVEFPEPTIQVSNRPAIEAMKETLLSSNEQIILIATGPLTNVGALLLAHPEVKSKIKYISYMGGAAVGGNMSPTAEFNVYVDPHAADIVFRSGIPIVMSGLDVTHKAYVTIEEINEMEAIGSDFASKVSQMLRFYIHSAKQTAFHAPNFENQIHLHDLCAVSYVLTPELFEGDNCHVAVELEGKYTAGTTIVDYAQQTGLPHNMKVLHTINREKFVEQFFHAVKQMSAD